MEIDVADEAFEIYVYRECIRVCPGAVMHSGSYIDFVTGKLREYDIRGEAPFKLNAGVRRARQPQSLLFTAECKNLSTNQYAVLVATSDAGMKPLHLSTLEARFEPDADTRLTPGFLSLYDYPAFGPGNEPMMCKGLYHSVNQYETDKPNEPLKRSKNDSSFYDKWAQSVNSLVDLVKSSRLHFRVDDSSDIMASFALLPIAVVPDGHLLGGTMSQKSTKVHLEQVDFGLYQLDAAIGDYVPYCPELRIDLAAFTTVTGFTKLLDKVVHGKVSR